MTMTFNEALIEARALERIARIDVAQTRRALAQAKRDFVEAQAEARRLGMKRAAEKSDFADQGLDRHGQPVASWKLGVNRKGHWISALRYTGDYTENFGTMSTDGEAARNAYQRRTHCERRVAELVQELTTAKQSLQWLVELEDEAELEALFTEIRTGLSTCPPLRTQIELKADPEAVFDDIRRRRTQTLPIAAAKRRLLAQRWDSRPTPADRDAVIGLEFATEYAGGRSLVITDLIQGGRINYRGRDGQGAGSICAKEAAVGLAI